MKPCLLTKWIGQSQFIRKSVKVILIMSVVRKFYCKTLNTHAWLLDRIRHRNLPLASHDDDTPSEMARNLADGITISDFPVTMEAARAARDLKVEVIAGAPNIVRGGSHSGNVSVMEMVRAGALDTIASDYVPAAMIEAVLRLSKARTRAGAKRTSASMTCCARSADEAT
jgi:alpha-D-ribose 1-methylphosphonate 5-triphosphate diphosphatase